MKIIHTSDWHLGQEFYSFDRSEEHISFLLQLQEIVAHEQPDALVISGDIFHNATPSNAVMKLFHDHIDGIRSVCPSMTIVVIAGNHDSSSRLEITRTLWEHLHVYVVGKIQKNDEGVDFKEHIIPVRRTDQEVCGYIVALPFVVPQAFPLVKADTPRDERQGVFMEQLADMVEATNGDNLPVVMMAHMAIAGSDITGHDLSQGGMDYLDDGELKVDYDYLALGHIHCPQTLKTHRELACVRYCGSPVAVNFDERYVHSVSVVNLPGHHVMPEVKTIPIQNPRPLKTIPATPVDFEEGLKELAKFPDEESAYIRLNVNLADVPPQNAFERANTLVEPKACRFCCFKWNKTKATVETKRLFNDIEQIKSHSPLSIAELYYENKFGVPLQEEYKEMLEEVIHQVQQELS